MKIQEISQMISRIIPNINQNQLNQSINKAQNFAGQVHNKNDALNILKELGISSGFLNKIQSFMGNPLANQLAKMTGTDMNHMNNAINELKNQTTPNKYSKNSLESLKKGLSQFKK